MIASGLKFVLAASLACGAVAADAAVTLTQGTTGYTGPKVGFGRLAGSPVDTLAVGNGRYKLPNDLLLDVLGTPVFAGLGSTYLDDGGNSDVDKVFVGRSDNTGNGNEVILRLVTGHYPLHQLGVYIGADGGDTLITAVDPNGDELGQFTVDLEALGKGERFFYVTSDSANIERLTVSGGYILGIGGFAGSVPEPESWALLLAGFGMIGVASRYRKTAKTVAA